MTAANLSYPVSMATPRGETEYSQHAQVYQLIYQLLFHFFRHWILLLSYQQIQSLETQKPRKT